MGIWKYSTEQNWFYSSHKTVILPIDEKIYKEPNFKWPLWAIKMANDLGGNSQAIQQVSKLLEEERKEKWQLQN